MVIVVLAALGLAIGGADQAMRDFNGSERTVQQKLAKIDKPELFGISLACKRGECR